MDRLLTALRSVDLGGLVDVLCLGGPAVAFTVVALAVAVAGALRLPWSSRYVRWKAPERRRTR